jgi:hypothetical protein
MTDQEFQIAVIAIVFGSLVSIAFIITVGTIIKSFLKRKSGPNLADNEEFLEALRQFKQKTDRRLSNLEAIVVDSQPPKKQTKSIKAPEEQKSIEIDEENKGRSSEGSLKNMLKE